MAETPPVKYGVFENKWLFWHTVIGGMVGRVLNESRIMGKYALEPETTIMTVFGMACGWEVLEAYIETPNKKAIEKRYGSVEAYGWDTTFDILGATLGAALAVRYIPRKKIQLVPKRNGLKLVVAF